jgi:hypothetical protein
MTESEKKTELEKLKKTFEKEKKRKILITIFTK